MSFWQGQRVRLRAMEPGDAAIFYEWNLDSERARNLDFLWPPSSMALVEARTAEQSLKGRHNDEYLWVIETLDGAPRSTLHEHLGFELEGVLRRMGYTRGSFYDTCWYGVTAEEFETRFGTQAR